jgi:hypothetical protein
MTGPRRSGKTTLLSGALPHPKYILLEDPGIQDGVRRDLRCLDPRCLGPRCLDPRCLGPRCLDPRCLGPRCLDPRCLDPRSLIESLHPPVIFDEIQKVE